MRIRSLALLAAVASTSLAVPSVVDQPAQAAPAAAQPNFVFVLMDDFSTELVQYMNGLEGLAERGVSFSTFVTSDPLCCPSRATILTGKYPHNTGVLNNQWPAGGLSGFLDGENEDDTIGVHLDAAGYRTGFMGKFLNGYKPKGGGGKGSEPAHPPNYVPPGWDEWFATGAGYQGFDYKVVAGLDGDAESVAYKGDDETNYLTDVVAERAVDFIDRNAADPFFLMVNPFATHGNAGGDPDPEGADGPDYPPAPRDRPQRATRPAQWDTPDFPFGGDCGNPLVGGGCFQVPFPDPSWGSSFNAPPRHAPAWYGTNPKPMTEHKIANLRESHIERIQMTQAVDDLIDGIEDHLEAAGVADNTYIVFATDNGYHLGQHAIGRGKSTAYDSDVVTPLIVLPPGGLDTAVIVDDVVQNTDFLPTFLELAGVSTPSDVDGTSFAAALDASFPAAEPRQGAIVEFSGTEDSKAGRGDPDVEEGDGLTPPKYVALRTADYLYVDYSVLDRTIPRKLFAEFYDLTVDPYQTNNIYRTLPRSQQEELNAALVDYADCAGAECREDGLDVPPL